jgi:NCAIR mutase (PurE)-related protein
MDPVRIRQLLDRVQKGESSVDAALDELRALPFRELGFATVDHHRHLRQGFPEVVFGLGKQTPHLIAIVRELAAGGSNVLATRLGEDVAAALCEAVPGVRHERAARACVLEQRAIELTGRGTVLVVSAGTSDVPVAEEAALTAHLMGSRVERIFDVGVAGIHRLLAQRERILSAEVIIVCAGMEGALASVVGGLVAKPVIAVPTSIGYGASFGGIAALLAMLNSCAAGVTVVNIDNGFGAGYAAALINRRVPE